MQRASTSIATYTIVYGHKFKHRKRNGQKTLHTECYHTIIKFKAQTAFVSPSVYHPCDKRGFTYIVSRLNAIDVHNMRKPILFKNLPSTLSKKLATSISHPVISYIK